MRQDKLTGSLRRGGRCLKRQGGGGGVGTILSNVLKKRSCISRTAPRLLCTLEPGEARAADGRWGAGVCGATLAWEGWEQTPAWVRSAATRARRTRRPAEATPRPMRLASVHGGGVREAAPVSPGRVTYCAPGSLEARPLERCVGWLKLSLDPTGLREGQRLRRAGDRERVFPRRVPVMCLCWGLARWLNS